MCVLISMLFVMAYEIIPVKLIFRNNHPSMRAVFVLQSRKENSCLQLKYSDYTVMYEIAEWLLNIFHAFEMQVG